MKNYKGDLVISWLWAISFTTRHFYARAKFLLLIVQEAE
jgi:hypothetical protein